MLDRLEQQALMSSARFMEVERHTVEALIEAARALAEARHYVYEATVDHASATSREALARVDAALSALREENP